jgi:hypothetical protein
MIDRPYGLVKSISFLDLSFMFYAYVEDTCVPPRTPVADKLIGSEIAGNVIGTVGTITKFRTYP